MAAGKSFGMDLTGTRFAAPCILYLNTIPGERTHEMTFAGIRRYAAARGWDVVNVQEVR